MASSSHRRYADWTVERIRREGGTSQLGAWALSFGTCGLACLAGAVATLFLPRNIWQR